MMDGYPTPIATVDVVLLTIHDEALSVVLLRRDKEPFAGMSALPGGYVHVGEDADAEATARRVLLEKTGLRAPYLEQLFTFADATRDPRGWSVSIAYFALVPEHSLVGAWDGGFEIVPVDALPELAFDHARIVAKGVERLRGKAAYSSLPAFLLPEEFTLLDLQEMYEKIMGVELDKNGFRRKAKDQGFVEEVPGGQRTGRHRPAQLYRLRDAALREFRSRI